MNTYARNTLCATLLALVACPSTLTVAPPHSAPHPSPTVCASAADCAALAEECRVPHCETDGTNTSPASKVLGCYTVDAIDAPCDGGICKAGVCS